MGDDDGFHSFKSSPTSNDSDGGRSVGCRARSSFFGRSAQRGGLGVTAADVKRWQDACDLLQLRDSWPMAGRGPSAVPCGLVGWFSQGRPAGQAHHL